MPNPFRRKPSRKDGAHPAIDVIAHRVMIVDDDESARERMRLLAQVGGFPHTCATNGAEALRILRQHPHPIVVTDRQMPEMDGLLLCRALRSGRYPTPLVIVMLTAHDSITDYITGLISGADEFLSKHASDVQVLARLNAANQRISQELRRHGV